MLVTQKADDIMQVEDRSKMKIQHLRARIYFTKRYSKMTFFSHLQSMQQHVSKFLRAQVRANAYSERQSMRIQKLNISHIYIALII